MKITMTKSAIGITREDGAETATFEIAVKNISHKVSGKKKFLKAS